MTDFRISYTNEADLAAYSASLPGAFTQTDPNTGIASLIDEGTLPGGVVWRMTDPQRNMVPNGQTVTDPDTGVVIPVMVSDGLFWRTLRFYGPNPFQPSGALPLPDPSKITVYPPVKYLPDGVTPDPSYKQPQVALFA